MILLCPSQKLVIIDLIEFFRKGYQDDYVKMDSIVYRNNPCLIVHFWRFSQYELSYQVISYSQHPDNEKYQNASLDHPYQAALTTSSSTGLNGSKASISPIS